MWKYANCEVQGSSHKKQQIPCQDKTKAVFLNGTYVIALSDGAGSAKMSQFGAACVVESIIELFASDFEDLYSESNGVQVKIRIIQELSKRIGAESERLKCTANDLASTLLAVAIKDDSFIIAHIGDGVIGYLDGNKLKVASAPDNGEFSNETFFVTSPNTINNMRMFKGKINNIAGFVIMSDGTEQSLYNKKNGTLNSAIIKLMQRNLLLTKSAMDSQMKSTFENVIAVKTYDDCSIALLSRENEVLHSYEKLQYNEKCALYNISSKNKAARKRIARYEMVLEHSKTPTTCYAMSRKIHIKPKYARKHLEKLHSIGLLRCSNGFYCT